MHRHLLQLRKTSIAPEDKTTLCNYIQEDEVSNNDTLTSIEDPQRSDYYKIRKALRVWINQMQKHQ